MTTDNAVSRVQDSLDAAHASQRSLNAFTSIDDDGALERATEIDRDVELGSQKGALSGVPIALKDLIDQANRTTTAGSAFYRNTPTRGAVCVNAIEAAGGVIVGRTGLHEFAFGFSSENPHWGAVRNPWDTNTSTGGSSGGSAAAVAAGITPIAIGTDTGGSVRVPAALCGTYALKVTHGRISLDGVFPLVPSLDTVGPLANSMRNLELAYTVMSNDESEAGSDIPSRIGIPQPWVDNSPTDDDIVGAFASALDSLTGLGFEVHPIAMPDVGPSVMIAHSIAPEVTAIHRAFLERGETYGPDVMTRLEEAANTNEEETRQARDWQAMIRNRFSDAFATVDLLVTPTVPVRRKLIGNELIGDLPYRTVLSYFSAVVNHSLHPAIALPLANSGIPPASLQVIGPLNSESSLLAFGRSLEKANVTRFIEAPKSSRMTRDE